MRNTQAIFYKQMTSLIKSPGMIVQGVLFAVMVLVFTFIMGPDRECDDCIPAYVCDYCMETNPLHSLPTPSITGMFTVMFIGMAMVGSASALVQEDKTTHNLRFMTMAGMKPRQYLLGTASALFITSIPLLFLFAMVGRHFGVVTLEFMVITASTALVSIILGIAVGLSKAPIIATPLSMALGMGPMFSSFNERLANFFHYTYTQQANLGIYHLAERGLQGRTFMIVGGNLLVILLVFVWMHRKGELRW
jgi:hypothetical protein